MSGGLWRLVTGVALLGVLAACQGATGPDPDAAGPDPATDPRAEAAEWFQPCPDPATTSPAPRTSALGAAPAPGAPTSPMPEVTLECLGRGRPVDLAVSFGVPTVVNVWASWCKPCREELPAFQRYADRTGGTVLVLGVAAGDTRTASLALAKDLGIRFPTMFDERSELTRALGRTALPVTVFIDAGGRLAYLYNGRPLTDRGLAALAAEHLGVAV